MTNLKTHFSQTLSRLAIGIALACSVSYNAVAAPIIGGLPDVIDLSDPVVIIEPAAEIAALTGILTSLTGLIDPGKLPLNDSVTQVIVGSVSADGFTLTTDDGIVYTILPLATHEYITGDPASSAMLHDVERVGLVSDSLFGALHIVRTVVYDIF